MYLLHHSDASRCQKGDQAQEKPFQVRLFFIAVVLCGKHKTCKHQYYSHDLYPAQAFVKEHHARQSRYQGGERDDDRGIRHWSDLQSGDVRDSLKSCYDAKHQTKYDRKYG